jgi:hypothetical protein
MAVTPFRVVVSDRLTHVDRVIAHDRAAVVTTAIVQIFRTAPPQEWQRAIESYLRDEFANTESAPDLRDEFATTESAPDFADINDDIPF